MGMHTGGITKLYIKWVIPLTEVENTVGDPVIGTPNGTTLDDLMNHGREHQIFDEAKVDKSGSASITKTLLKVETGDGPGASPMFGNPVDLKQIMGAYKRYIRQAEELFAKAGYRKNQINQIECIDVH